MQEFIIEMPIIIAEKHIKVIHKELDYDLCFTIGIKYLHCRALVAGTKIGTHYSLKEDGSIDWCSGGFETGMDADQIKIIESLYNRVNKLKVFV